ncbi:MAG: histidine ammonia-lyase [Lachnospiraceae bacterium]|nr:histidine ammonia-lyase [Lachnospiraceae bacterium]
MSVILDGNHLTIEEVIRVSRGRENVSLSDFSVKAVNKSRSYVEKKLDEGALIYGLTTGFGKFSDTIVKNGDARALQKNLILSHACGMGEPFKEETARAILLLRINALSKGFSGIRLSTIEGLIAMLNKGVTPVIPMKGSLGASGDLALLAHMVLPLLGLGEVYYKGERVSGAIATKDAGIKTIELESKEGLALINGTQALCAVGTLALYDTWNLARIADIVAAMSAEALLGITKAFDKKIHEARGIKGQIDVAMNLRNILKGSKLAKETNPDKVQDAYSIRCTPQIHGGTREALVYIQNLVNSEINAATDNPLIFADEDEVISGGNFHGQPLAIAFDTLGIAASELANVSERRIERLVNPSLNEGLPAFLTRHGGLNSGFMIAQYSAASMVSENKIYAHPASVDSIPSSANQEDHVSMGSTAAQKAAKIVENTRRVLGIELFSVCQALDLRGEENLSPATRKVYDCVRRAGVPFVEEDILMAPEMKKCEELLMDDTIIKAAESVCGKLL